MDAKKSLNKRAEYEISSLFKEMLSLLEYPKGAS